MSDRSNTRPGRSGTFQVGARCDLCGRGFRKRFAFEKHDCPLLRSINQAEEVIDISDEDSASCSNRDSVPNNLDGDNISVYCDDDDDIAEVSSSDGNSGSVNSDISIEQAPASKDSSQRKSTSGNTQNVVICID